MLRNLSAEGYKLKKSKSFYFCAAAVVCFVAILFATFYFVDCVQKGEVENGAGGFTVFMNGEEVGNASIWDSVSLMELLRQLFAGSMLSCTIAVFVSIFVCGEYGSGMVKNVVGKGCPRASVYAAKLIMAEFASICIAAIGILLILIVGRIFMGPHVFEGHFWPDFFTYIGMQLTVLIAEAALFVLVSEVCRMAAAGIAFNIGMIIFSLLIINGLDVLVPDSGLQPSEIWPIGQTERLPLEGFTSDIIIQNTVVAVAWFAIALFLGIWHFNKTDIK